MPTLAHMGVRGGDLILTGIEHRSKRLLDVDKNESDDKQGDNADLPQRANKYTAR